MSKFIFFESHVYYEMSQSILFLMYILLFPTLISISDTKSIFKNLMSDIYNSAVKRAYKNKKLYINNFFVDNISLKLFTFLR